MRFSNFLSLAALISLVAAAPVADSKRDIEARHPEAMRELIGRAPTVKLVKIKREEDNVDYDEAYHYYYVYADVNPL
jgi:hypothetical protein